MPKKDVSEKTIKPNPVLPGTQITFSNSLLLTQVSGLVFDKERNLYACNFGTPSANIVKIDKHGNVTPLTTQFSNDRNFVSMVCLDNFLYVTGFNNCVYKVDIHSGDLTTFVTLPDNGTNGLAFYNDAFYVVTADGMNSGSVYKVTLDGKVSVFIDKAKLIGTQYNIIAFDTNGDLYITDEGNSAVAKYDHKGNLINSKFISGPYQSVIVNQQYIYVTNYTMNQISQYRTDGSPIKENFAVGGLTFAGGAMAFDVNGDFYCSLEKDMNAGSGNVTLQMIKH